jgi:hypothetical protein
MSLMMGTMRRGPRLALALLAAVALLLAGTTIGEAAPAGGAPAGPSAAHAAKGKGKKKAKHKKRRKKRCKPRKHKRCPKAKKPKPGTPGTSGLSKPPVSGSAPTAPAGSGTVTGAAAIAQFTRALAGSQLTRYKNTMYSSYSDQFSFSCGTFTEHTESITTTDAGSSSSVNDYKGTWKVVDAAVASDGSRGQARVDYTSNNPASTSGEVVVTLIGSNQAFLGDVEYGRSGGGAAC